MYKIEGEWVQVERIFKLLNKDISNSDEYMIDAIMDESPVVVTKKWIGRRDITAIEESTDYTRDTLGCDNVYLISTTFEQDLPVVLNEREVMELLSLVGDAYINDGNRKDV